ncbi:hypothetical protein EON65_10595, partial [archaeon]
GRLEEGAKVEVNYGGKGKYFPGKISKARLDGTFDILYDDGDSETRVREDWIRLQDVIHRSHLPSDEITIGALVEANYRGKGTYFSGRIKKVHLGGNYDVEYDDGDVETQVPKSSIRSYGTLRDSSPPKSKLSLGSNVQVNYNRKGRYFPARIIQVRADGTYDIEYDNGELEDHVRVEYIRSGDRSLDASRNKRVEYFSLVDGSKVEVNYLGKGTWFPGKVMKVHSNATYDIRFDDGEEEFKVPQSRIRDIVGGK